MSGGDQEGEGQTKSDVHAVNTPKNSPQNLPDLSYRQPDKRRLRKWPLLLMIISLVPALYLIAPGQFYRLKLDLIEAYQRVVGPSQRSDTSETLQGTGDRGSVCGQTFVRATDLSSAELRDSKKLALVRDCLIFDGRFSDFSEHVQFFNLPKTSRVKWTDPVFAEYLQLLIAYSRSWQASKATRLAMHYCPAWKITPGCYGRLMVAGMLGRKRPEKRIRNDLQTASFGRNYLPYLLLAEGMWHLKANRLNSALQYFEQVRKQVMFSKGRPLGVFRIATDGQAYAGMLVKKNPQWFEGLDSDLQHLARSTKPIFGAHRVFGALTHSGLFGSGQNILGSVGRYVGFLEDEDAIIALLKESVRSRRGLAREKIANLLQLLSGRYRLLAKDLWQINEWVARYYLAAGEVALAQSLLSDLKDRRPGYNVIRHLYGVTMLSQSQKPRDYLLAGLEFQRAHRQKESWQSLVGLGLSLIRGNRVDRLSPIYSSMDVQLKTQQKALHSIKLWKRILRAEELVARDKVSQALVAVESLTKLTPDLEYLLGLRSRLRRILHKRKEYQYNRLALAAKRSSLGTNRSYFGDPLGPLVFAVD